MRDLSAQHKAENPSLSVIRGGSGQILPFRPKNIVFVYRSENPLASIHTNEEVQARRRPSDRLREGEWATRGTADLRVMHSLERTLALKKSVIAGFTNRCCALPFEGRCDAAAQLFFWYATIHYHRM